MMNNYEQKEEFKPDQYKKFNEHENMNDVFDQMKLEDGSNPLTTENQYDNYGGYDNYNYNNADY